jgi:DNA (cytosine-5)-methyltransferase 1
VLRKNFPDIEIFGDISDLKGYKGWINYKYHKSGARDGIYDLSIERPVDVITGGFPCQDISNSGNKSGLLGNRSKYWFEYLRLINEIKPKGVIIENVSAIKTRGLREVLEGLSKVGYDAEWHVIPSGYCGAIHKRDRMFILAYPTSIGQQESWQPLKSFGKKETRDREANIIKYALSRSSLPYVCRDHDGSAGRVDRLKQVGNTVYWPIVERLGYHLADNIKRMEYK